MLGKTVLRGMVVVAGLAGCVSTRATVSLQSLSVVPPAPGECIGTVEATFVNESGETLHVGTLEVLENGKTTDHREGVYPLGGYEPEFAALSDSLGARLEFENSTLAPGASCVLSTRLVRVHGGSTPTVRFGVRANAMTSAEVILPVMTGSVKFDLASWPVAEALGPDAMGRVLDAGQDVTIAVESNAMPGGGMFSLSIGPGGRARGAGFGRFPGRGDSGDGFEAAGKLSPEQRAPLHAALRAAPFAAFRADPRYLTMCDGHPVRLVVAAGPAAFVGCSQQEDFEKAGLLPLLEHLRLLLRDLPDAGKASPPAPYEYGFPYLGNSPPLDRMAHVRRVLADRGAGVPLVLLGRALGPLGSDAAAAWLSTWPWMWGLPGADETIGRVFAAPVPGPDATTFDLALTTAALAGAVQARRIEGRMKDGPPVAGRAGKELLQSLADRAVALAARQLPDGTWGGPVETAWSLSALRDAYGMGVLVRVRVGEGWKRAGPAVVALWAVPLDPEGLSAVDRLHRAAAVWLAEGLLPEGAPRVAAAWYQDRFREFDPGDDADAWFSAGFLWQVLGPSADPDHPLQACKAQLHEAYRAGRLRARSPGETLAYATAIEAFGWDAFGSVMGYLRVDDWPSREEK